MIHVYYMPYANSVLNKIELLSIVTMTITMYAGLFFVNDINNIVTYFVVILMIIFNSAFLLIWLLIWIRFSIRASKIETMLTRLMPVRFQRSLNKIFSYRSKFKEEST